MDHAFKLNTDYPLAALEFLLDAGCLPERYYGLIPFKGELMQLGCGRKSDVDRLPDETLAGIVGEGNVPLLRRFLALYEVRPQKLRELERLSLDPERRAAYGELYLLPGVKQVRAELYFCAGFRSLRDIASSTPEKIVSRTAETITSFDLDCTVPLPKELRTHIAVARAITL